MGRGVPAHLRRDGSGHDALGDLDTGTAWAWQGHEQVVRAASAMRRRR